MGRCIPPPPRAMGCNRNGPDINTTTVGGRGGGGDWGAVYTGCHCPVTAGQKGGGGFGKWTSVTPRGRKPIFAHPIYFGTLDNTLSFYIGSSDWCHEVFLLPRGRSTSGPLGFIVPQ